MKSADSPSAMPTQIIFGPIPIRAGRVPCTSFPPNADSSGFTTFREPPTSTGKTSPSVHATPATRPRVSTFPISATISTPGRTRKFISSPNPSFPMISSMTPKPVMRHSRSSKPSPSPIRNPRTTPFPKARAVSIPIARASWSPPMRRCISFQSNPLSPRRRPLPQVDTLRRSTASRATAMRSFWLLTTSGPRLDWERCFSCTTPPRLRIFPQTGDLLPCAPIPRSIVMTSRHTPTLPRHSPIPSKPSKVPKFRGNPWPFFTTENPWRRRPKKVPLTVVRPPFAFIHASIRQTRWIRL